MASFKKLADKPKVGKQVAQADTETNAERRKRELEQMGTGKDLTEAEKAANEEAEKRQKEEGRKKLQRG